MAGSLSCRLSWHLRAVAHYDELRPVPIFGHPGFIATPTNPLSVLVASRANALRSLPTDHTDDLHHTERRWFAIRTGHRKEKVVAKLLGRSGVEHMLPLRDRPYQYRSKRGVRKLPLLPGYLFVRLIAAESPLIWETSFTYGFVKVGRNRLQIHQPEIDLLLRLSTEHTLEWKVEEKVNTLEEGCPVEISKGPLAGVRGHYVRAKGRSTFIIALHGMDGDLYCEVPPELVIPITTPLSDSPGFTLRA